MGVAAISTPQKEVRSPWSTPSKAFSRSVLICSRLVGLFVAMMRSSECTRIIVIVEATEVECLFQLSHLP